VSGAQSQMAHASPEETVGLLQQELEATNREVMLLTLELEQRVAERTSELAASNRELLKEVAERMRAQTKIKKLNQILTQRAELLEVANSELEAYSASVSHDLRNPLTRIVGYAALLRDGAGPGLGQKNMEYVERICAAGTQMTGLISDLLRLSHAAQTELAWLTVDMNALVEKSIDELEHELRGRNVVWKRPELPIVCGDASLLKQVMVNLISNALKYSRRRDRAEIEIAALSDSSEETVLYVRDNGVGFDPATSRNLFGAFQRLHRKEEFEGTGVGLANVRRIVLRHGGRVWAEAIPGSGATFYFSLPKQRPA
jgi:light-regulated signal transduction histidine kinase (bacteriophytochrome)